MSKPDDYYFGFYKGVFITSLFWIALHFFISGCVAPASIPQPVPAPERFIPKNPTTQERVLKKNCRLYVNSVSNEMIGWRLMGDSLITQESEENSSMYKVFDKFDYDSAYASKGCFK